MRGARRPRAPRRRRPVPLLECRRLSRRFGGLVAVDAVALAGEPGEVRAVIGPNGAGKSTLFNVITGVLAPSEGENYFAGERITALPVHRVIQKGVARTFQLTHLFPALTARENVRIAAQARRPDRWRPLAGAAVFAATAEAADAALALIGLADVADVKAGLLSHGNQRLLDEPTQGLSVEETDQAVRILGDMLRAGGLTVILVEHDMEVVFRLADKITVLHRGRVIADGAPDAVKANAEVQSAYLGGI